MSKWQPIETAPRDGTAVLVYFERIGVHQVSWVCTWSDDLAANGSWHVDDLKHGPYPLRKYLEGDDTHWMPLPDPPRHDKGAE